MQRSGLEERGRREEREGREGWGEVEGEGVSGRREGM